MNLSDIGYFIIMLALTAALFGEVVNGHSFAGDVIRSIPTVEVKSSGFVVGNKDVGEPKAVIEEKQFVAFYGMSSDAANTKHFGGLKDYRSSEGREVLVPYRGSVGITIQDLTGGLRSTCTYAGALKLKQLSKCTTFVRCTQQFNAVYAGK
jgi:GMP reductase